MPVRKTVAEEARRYNKIVIWGLKTRFHTHRYIHQGFYTTLQKLGTVVIWLDDTTQNNRLIKTGDLVISADIAGYNLKLRDDVYYCLHNFNLKNLEYSPQKCLQLQVYTTAAETADLKLDEVTFFDQHTNTLCQPWGTNLLESEFKKPNAYLWRLPVVFWIGSIWNNPLNQGNLDEIAELRKSLSHQKIPFIALRNRVPEPLAIELTRRSVISPAIAGRWQVENNYLPCRMFKNISYGVLGISNVKKFQSLFKDCSIDGKTITDLILNALDLSKREMNALIIAQQDVVKDHTYERKLLNIFQCLQRIND